MARFNKKTDLSFDFFLLYSAGWDKGSLQMIEGWGEPSYRIFGKIWDFVPTLVALVAFFSILSLSATYDKIDWCINDSEKKRKQCLPSIFHYLEYYRQLSSTDFRPSWTHSWYSYSYFEIIDTEWISLVMCSAWCWHVNCGGRGHFIGDSGGHSQNARRRSQCCNITVPLPHATHNT